VYEGFDTAQICCNGHVITAGAASGPEFRAPFCATCGSATIMACDSCKAAIRGWYHVPGFIGGHDYERPGFCHMCGVAYPWTRARLAAARELTEILEGFTVAERQQLSADLEDLVRDGPRTPVAQVRWKQALAKAGSDVYQAVKSILLDVVSETVKKVLFPGT
jgi:hypothetical protein